MNKLSEISKIARNINIYYKNRFSTEELSSNTYEALRLIVKHPGINSSFLVSRMNIDKALVSRIISSLEKMGYITLALDSKDKRYKTLNPTSKAVDLKLADEKERDEFYSYLEKFIPQEKKDNFFDVLEVLYEKSKELRHSKFAELEKENENNRD